MGGRLRRAGAGNGIRGGQAKLIRLTQHLISVRASGGCFCTFDLEGRPVGVHKGKRSYWRGLDNRVLAKWGGGPHLYRRRRRVLTARRRDALFRSVHRTLQGVAETARRGDAQVEVEASGDPLMRQAAKDWPERLLRWDVDRLRGEEQRFARVYRPVGILPPDQYPAVVVQIVEGCPWNACTFCTLYRDRVFRVKTDEEITAHLSGIEALLGEGMRVRKTVFLGDANALSMPQGQLIATMERIRERLDMLPEGLTAEERVARKRRRARALEGFYAFMDVFSDDRRRASEFRQLREGGLRRLYLGAEAGDDELLRILNKPSTVEQLMDTVHRVKAGGMSVGVIFLLGLGGRQFAERHERGIVNACRRLPLSAGDMVYLSPLVTTTGSAYADWEVQEDIRPLCAETLAEQEQRVVSALRSFLPAGVRVAPYDLREFVY